MLMSDYFSDIIWRLQVWGDRNRHWLQGVGLASLVGLVAISLLSVALARGGLAEISNIRFGVNKQGITRIVVDMSDNAAYRVITKDEGRFGALQIDIAAKAVTIPTAMMVGTEIIGTGHGVGRADAFSYKLLGGQDARIQIDQSLNDYAVPTAVFLLKPRGNIDHYRLVIDLKPTDIIGFQASLDKPFGTLPPISTSRGVDMATRIGPPVTAKTSSSTPNPSLAQSDGREAPFATADNITPEAPLTDNGAIKTNSVLSYPPAKDAPIPRLKPAFVASARYTIVIDPGHGGRDPGAVGPQGIFEKNVTLTSAKELKKILEGRGYYVILTRSDDQYLDRDKKKDLEKRIALARESRGDLFLSLHADAHDDSSIRGASVYSLSDKGSDRLMRKVSVEGNFVIAGEDLSVHGDDTATILMDIAENRTRGASSRFANLLVSELGRKITMLNNTHREASYAVLLSPDVPAVLLELGFVSNASDEKNLQSKRWRKKTLGAVADAIDDYFETEQPIQQASVSGGTP